MTNQNDRTRIYQWFDCTVISFFPEVNINMQLKYNIFFCYRMIEEFMLLANMAVARRIYRAFPKQAVLRRHKEPQEKQLNDLEAQGRKLGLQIDASNSQTLQVGNRIP